MINCEVASTGPTSTLAAASPHVMTGVEGEEGVAEEEEEHSSLHSLITVSSTEHHHLLYY